MLLFVSFNLEKLLFDIESKFSLIYYIDMSCNRSMSYEVFIYFIKIQNTIYKY